MTGTDTCYLSVGSQLRLSAAAMNGGGDHDHAVTLVGRSNHYPVLGLHMSRADALRLVTELLDAVHAGSNGVTP